MGHPQGRRRGPWKQRPDPRRLPQRLLPKASGGDSTTAASTSGRAAAASRTTAAATSPTAATACSSATSATTASRPKPFDTGSASWVEMTTVSTRGKAAATASICALTGGRRRRRAPSRPAGPPRRHARAVLHGRPHEGGIALERRSRLTSTLTGNVSMITATGRQPQRRLHGQAERAVAVARADPVDAKEMARNDAVFPTKETATFVDLELGRPSSSAVRPRPRGSRRSGSIELHFNNVGADLSEFVGSRGARARTSTAGCWSRV